MVLAAVVIQLFSLQSFAQSKISDPQNLLPSIRAYAGVKPLKQAFVCGTNANYKSAIMSCDEIRCDDSGCWTFCKTVDEPQMSNRSVVNCTDESVQLFTDATGDLADVPRAQYDANGKNVAEFFLSDLGRYINWNEASVSITSVAETPFTLARGTPKERKVEAMNVMFELGEEKTAKFQGVISILKVAPGVAQIGRLRLDSTTFFMLDDYAEVK